MSDDDINKSIINFINNNYGKNSNKINSIIESEIDDVLSNINNNSCSYEYRPINIKTILGISTNVNKSIIDLTYLIPNLFRKCYLQQNMKLPNICPKFTNSNDNIIINYFPYLLEENLIKSFLYFNFPASYINSSNIINNVNIIRNLEKIVKRRIKTVNKNITPGQMISNLYSPTSMLLQLINFQKYIDISNYSINLSKIINYFKIKWDFTISCFSYTENINDSYFVMNDANNFNDIYSVIDQYTANNIYDIKLSYVNNFINNNKVNNNNTIILFYQNIYTILNYVLDVYTDISLQIQSYQSGFEYCKKPYMRISNIPTLLKLYNMFYNNQLKSLAMQAPSNSVESIVSTRVSLEKYIESFINIINSTYGTSLTYLKTVILNNNLDAFVFYLNGSIEQAPVSNSNYNYFYININNPSYITLHNYTVTVGLGSLYTSVDLLVIRFNRGFSSWVGYLSLNNVSYTTFVVYNCSGLYPNFGADTTPQYSQNPRAPPLNIGYLYYYWDSQNKLISTVFFSLRENVTINPFPPYDNISTGHGLILENYHR